MICIKGTSDASRVNYLGSSQWNIREEFGKGRVKVYAEFDSIPYNGSIVNMGVKDENGDICYVIGLLKAIRKQLNKGDGDSVHVVIRERNM